MPDAKLCVYTPDASVAFYPFKINRAVEEDGFYEYAHDTLAGSSVSFMLQEDDSWRFDVDLPSGQVAIENAPIDMKDVIVRWCQEFCDNPLIPPYARQV